MSRPRLVPLDKPTCVLSKHTTDPETKARPCVGVWTYRSSAGEVIGYVARYQNAGEDKKHFVPYFKPNGVGFKAGYVDGKRTLYGQDTLGRGGVLYIPEGERKADALHSMGVAAVSPPGGAKQAHLSDYSSCTGFDEIVVLADYDPPNKDGTRAGEQWAAAVVAALPQARIVRLRTKGETKYDLVDWLEERLPEWNSYDPVPVGSEAVVAELVSLCEQSVASEATNGKSATAHEVEISSSPEGLAPNSDFEDNLLNWPSRLSDTAFRGVLGDFVREMEPFTEADASASLFGAYACFSALIGSGRHVQLSGSRVGLNLYVAITGPSADGRKNEALKPSKALTRLVDPLLKIDSGLQSGQRLPWRLRDAKEGDPGVTDKRLLLFEEELLGVLNVRGLAGSVLVPMLLQAFDSDTIQTATKNDNGGFTVTMPHVSLIGCLTTDGARTALTAKDRSSGLVNRIAFAMARRSKSVPLTPPGIMDAIVAKYAPRVLDAIRFAGEKKGLLAFDPTGEEAWVFLHGLLTRSRTGASAECLSRAATHTLKLAGIAALLEMSNVVRSEHLKTAAALWKYAEDSAEFLFSDGVRDRRQVKLLHALKAAPGRKLTRTGVYDNVFGCKLLAAEVDAVLAKFVADGLVDTVREEGGGRPVTWYVLRQAS